MAPLPICIALVPMMLMTTNAWPLVLVALDARRGEPVGTFVVNTTWSGLLRRNSTICGLLLKTVGRVRKCLDWFYVVSDSLFSHRFSNTFDQHAPVHRRLDDASWWYWRMPLDHFFRTWESWLHSSPHICTMREYNIILLGQHFEAVVEIKNIGLDTHLSGTVGEVATRSCLAA